MKVSNTVIKEIAKQLDAGNTCYVSRKNLKIITLREGTEDTEEGQKSLEVVGNEKYYLKITRMPTDQRIHIMKMFLEEAISPSIRKELTNALNRQNPMRNFKQVVNCHEDILQYWTNFKHKQHQQWVADFMIAAYNY